nr:ABC transporter ATP-binding protein [Synechococcus sp. RS9902]
MLPGLGLCFIILIIVSSTIRSLTIRNQLRLGSLICADLGKITFKSVLNNSYEWHVQNNSSNIISLLTQDVDRVGSIIKGLLTLCVNSTLILIVGIYLFLISPQIMVSACISISLFYILIFRLFRKDFRKIGKDRTLNYRKSLNILQESLGGIRELMLGNHYNIFVDNYDFYNRKRLLNDAVILIKSSIPRYLVEGFLIIIITLVALFYVILGNELTFLLPTLAAVSLGAYKLMQPLQQCFNTLGSLQANKSPLEEFKKHTGTNDSFNDKFKDVSISLPQNYSDEPLIKFNNVCFQYANDENLTLQNIDVSISKGEFVALVGVTGSGKSTFVDLVLGLLKPSKGNILIDNEDVHQNQKFMESWQKRLAHVPQSIYLSDNDIESNIAYGVPYSDINRSRLRLAAQQASIDSFIETLPNGFNTTVGERGISLSGGQRQRIGIARALYKQSELLVLDEATSALDNYTEHQVMTSIKELKTSVTVIAIAHRLSTIMHCDRIIVLDKGTIKGIGTYDELIANNSIFRSLVNSSASG